MEKKPVKTVNGFQTAVERMVTVARIAGNRMTQRGGMNADLMGAAGFDRDLGKGTFLPESDDPEVTPGLLAVLHARSVRLVHPRTHESLFIQAPLSDECEAVLGRLDAQPDSQGTG